MTYVGGRFRVVGDKDWQSVRVVPSNATSLTLHGLQSDTVYQFTVLARDQNGTARFSRVTSATTRSTSFAPLRLSDSEITPFYASKYAYAVFMITGI